MSDRRAYICENCGGRTEPMTHAEYLRRAESGRLVYCLICAAFAAPKRLCGLTVRRAA